MIGPILAGAPQISGDDLYREMLASCARLRNVQISISRSYHAIPLGPAYPTNEWEIAYASSRIFCIQLADSGGFNGGTYTSDGHRLYSDWLDAGKAPRDILDLKNFATGTTNYCTLFDFMRGHRSAIELAPGEKVTTTDSGIRFKTKAHGILDIVLIRRNGYLLPLIIDEDRNEETQALRRQHPEWEISPDLYLDRCSITYKFVDGFPSGTFRPRFRLRSLNLPERKAPSGPLKPDSPRRTPHPTLRT